MKVIKSVVIGTAILTLLMAVCIGVHLAFDVVYGFINILFPSIYNYFGPATGLFYISIIITCIVSKIVYEVIE